MFGYSDFKKGREYSRKRKAALRQAHFLHKNKTAVKLATAATGGAASAGLANLIMKRKEAKTGKKIDKNKRLAILAATGAAGLGAGYAGAHYGSKSFIKSRLKKADEYKKLARKHYTRGAIKAGVQGAVAAGSVHFLAPGLLPAAGKAALAGGKAVVSALGPVGTAISNGAHAIASWGAAHGVSAATTAAKVGGVVGANYLTAKALKKL